jgi:hypothetical protein
MFDRLPYPAADYHICPCCGTEFGSDDAQFSHAQLREMWVASGAYWFFGNPSPNWNPWMQLIAGGHTESVPPFSIKIRMPAATITVAGTGIEPLQFANNYRWELSAAA